MNLYTLLRKILFLFDPERAHALSLVSLNVLSKTGLIRLFAEKRIDLPVTVMGIEFSNPVGLAAGLDKNGDYIDALADCGFGFVEIGTVTPEPQPGNPRPRLFRLVEDRAIINRMGFNNKGVDHLISQVKKCRRKCVIGINIGKNKNTPLDKAVDDYRHAFIQSYPHADYVTVNISSPNTPGLRELQHGKELDNLLRILKREQKILHSESERYVPLVVKIAPDLEDAEVAALSATFIKHDIDGVIATNTTNDKSGLIDNVLFGETGGLSGQPLTKKSDHILRTFSERLNKKIPIIAAGGIMSPDDAKRKIELGASLVQVYTGFIYSGPSLISACVKAISNK